MKLVINPHSAELAELDEKTVKKIAQDMVNIAGKIPSLKESNIGEYGSYSVLVYYDIAGRQLAKEIASLCAKKGCRVWYRVREMDMESLLANELTERNLARHLAFTDNEIFSADAVFMIRAPRDPSIFEKVPDAKMRVLSKAQKPILLDYRVNHTMWQLIYWPTPYEAKIENMSYEDYVKLFFNACNQPWDKIELAQKILVDLLNKGKRLTLIANSKAPDKSKRTHLEMSIDGMEFANSTIDRNYPGSEVFSSPVRNSVNGQMFGEGKYLEEGRILEDIYFEVKEGKIINATAGKGQEHLDNILNRDVGARYFGEVALGTNPGIRQRLFNPLLNEKVGGSFHITPGKAYEMEEYQGKPVKVDNGNRSEIHWDITIMMLPGYGGGEVKVDDKTIQKDGKFTINGLEILNRGL